MSYVEDLEIRNRRAAIEANEKAEQARQQEAREKEAAWIEFEFEHDPTTRNFSRPDHKIFYPFIANKELLNDFVVRNNLRFSLASLEQAFKALESRLAVIDPAREYTTKTLDETGHKQPIPQFKVSTRFAHQPSPLPVEIDAAAIRAAEPNQIRMWIRKFGNAQLNERLNGR